jgi:hypothetical protein
MSRTASELPPKIHPERVKWKYFYWDQRENKIKHCTEARAIPPFARSDDIMIEQRNKVAFLTTSLFFALTSKSQTPARLKALVETALYYRGRPSEFCVALPYEDGHESYYEIADQRLWQDELIPYINIVAHDTFNPFRKNAYMSPKAGAEQIASAIENGFHIHAIAGGSMFGAKLELVRDYFRARPLLSDHKRRVLAGFSNVSEGQFGLKEFVEYIHAGNAGRIFSRTWPTDPARRREMIAIFEEQRDHEIFRILNCENEASYNEVKRRCQENSEPIRFSTYHPCLLISAIDSPYRPNFTGEKLILGLEGYVQSETGYNVSEALEYGLKTVFVPEQIIAIVVENIVVKEDEMHVRRVDGRVPEYARLTRSEKNKILEILRESNEGLFQNISPDQKEELINGYIARANIAYDNEVRRIKEVADRYGIPIIFGGAIRGGHAQNFIIQPSHVTGLQFDDQLQRITINSSIRWNEQVEAILPPKMSPSEITPKLWEQSSVTPLLQEDSVVYLPTPPEENRMVEENYSYSKNVAPAPQDDSLDHEIMQLRIEPANARAQAFLQDERSIEFFAVIAGVAGNISERNLDELNNKGLICIMPNRVDGKAVHQDFDNIKLHNSGRFGPSAIIDPIPGYRIPFVILAAQEPHTRNEVTLRPTLRDFNPEVPIFFATNFPFQKKLLQNLPPLFEASVNIRAMARMAATTIQPTETTNLRDGTNNELERK